MILKASQRGGGQNLAGHLLRLDENDHVEVHELRGFIADDLHGAFKEAHAISKGTKCKQYLFSLSLSPPETENVPVHVFERTADEVEQRLGLGGHPRALVFHEKNGRRHAHCVWSRIDPETMTAKKMSFFKARLSDLSRDLYLEHGWDMPAGLRNKSLRDPTTFTLAEWQQAQRADIDPRELKRIAQTAWSMSDSAKGFGAALREQGLFLAKGDRRGLVLVTPSGEAFGPNRTLGVRAKDVKARLGNSETYRSVSEVKAEFSDMLGRTANAQIEHAREMFKRRSATFDHRKMNMRFAHRGARDAFKADLTKRRKLESQARSERLPRGMRAIWARLTGKLKRLRDGNMQDARRCAARDRSEWHSFVNRQLKERLGLEREWRSARKVQAKTLLDIRDTYREAAGSFTPHRARTRTGPKRSR